MLEYGDYLMSTVAYFTKDSSFYQEALNIFILPENIQTEGFIQSIKDLIEKKIKYLEKTEPHYHISYLFYYPIIF